MDASQLASLIEHTALKADMTDKDIEALCVETKEHNFYGACVAPAWVAAAAAFLRSSHAKVISVVGFPLGNTTMKVKVVEALNAMEDGASEIDMVMNVGAFKSGEINQVAQEIETVSRALHHRKGGLLKVIIETALLTISEKKLATRLCADCGADFVKTSTGFAGDGATVEDVRLIKQIVGDRVRIKAAGGIRDLNTALFLIEAGADRIGSSASVDIITQVPGKPSEIPSVGNTLSN